MATSTLAEQPEPIQRQAAGAELPLQGSAAGATAELAADKRVRTGDLPELTLQASADRLKATMSACNTHGVHPCEHMEDPRMLLLLPLAVNVARATCAPVRTADVT